VPPERVSSGQDGDETEDAVKILRPPLRRIPLAEGWVRPGVVTITMSVGQWDALLQASYDAGFLLLELDDKERPIALYQKTCVEASS